MALVDALLNYHVRLQQESAEREQRRYAQARLAAEQAADEQERPRFGHMPITGNGATLDELGVRTTFRCSAPWCTALISRDQPMKLPASDRTGALLAGWTWLRGRPYCSAHDDGGG